MNKLKSILVIGVAMFSLALGSVALAQGTTTTSTPPTATGNLNTVGNAIGGTTATETTLLNQVGTIIKAIISFLGVIALIMVIYAGFLWMTSGGSDDKSKKAITLMKNGAIGLLIILSAYSITTFVFSKIIETTGTTI